jgi:hypothetical protein
MQDLEKIQKRIYPPMVEGDHTLGTVSDKIGDVTLKKKTPFHWFIGFGIAFMVAAIFGSYASGKGNRHLGKQPAGRLGIRHHQLCLVDRHRPRGNSYFGDSFAP